MPFRVPQPRAFGRRSTLVPVLLAATLATLSGCGGSSVDKAATVAGYNVKCGLPAPTSEKYRVTTPTGSSCVGSTIAFAEDPSRKDVFGPDPARLRSVQLRVWYPAANATGIARAAYSTDPVYAAFQWPETANRAHGNSLNNAPVAANSKYPVLLFSPGYGFPADLYTGMAEDLASHGYIVVGITHPNTSGAVTYPDGRVDPGVVPKTAEEMLPLAAMMVEDQRFVLNWLQQHAGDRTLPFSGTLDFTRVGSYGHSVGGSTALQLQRTDARVKAAANLDGYIWGDVSTPWTKPWMILYAERELDPTYAVFKANPRADSSLVQLPKTGHHDFSDLARWRAIAVKTLPAAQVPEDPDLVNTDPDGLEKRLRTDLRTFFDRTVK